MPLANLKIIGANNEFIAVSKQLFIKHSLSRPDYLGYIENIKKNPFKLYMASIRKSKTRDVELIPMGVAIINEQRQYSGAILTNLLVDRLMDKAASLVNHLKNITLQNLDNYNSKKKQSIFTLKKLFLHIFKEEPIIASQQLNNYPFIISAKINSREINQSFLQAIYLCIGSSLLFFIGAYVLYNDHCKLYKQLLDTIKLKINEFPNNQLDFDNNPTKTNLINIIHTTPHFLTRSRNRSLHSG